MKKVIAFIITIIILLKAFAQNPAVSISFRNNYEDVYHLSLIIYTPDGKSQTRVSDLQPGGIKKYVWPAGTEIFLADWKQEAFAMKGNDIKATGIKPWLVLQKRDNGKNILLSSVSIQRNPEPVKAASLNAADALGTWVIDLRPAPESEPYLKDFVFTKIEGNRFSGEFYGYPFSGGFINTRWDKIYFAFTTSDQNSSYFHSGYIEGNVITGMTLNEKREFLQPWRGNRKP